MARTLKPADDEPELRSNVSEEATVRVYVSRLVGLQADRKAITDKINTLRKQAKADGLMLGELDRVIKMSTWEPDEIRASVARTEAYSRFLGQPIGTQGSLFDDPRLPEVERLREKWRARGFSDGVKGVGWADQPPDECHQDCHVAYGEGHEAGQRQLHDDLLATGAKDAA